MLFILLAGFAELRGQTIVTISGTGVPGFNGDSLRADTAQLSAIECPLVDNTGNIYIPDWGNSRVRKVDTSGYITTIAGKGIQGYTGDNGPAIEASFRGLPSLAFDSHSNLYITDANNNVVRKVSPSGIITTIAGTGTQGFSGDNGAAKTARLSIPWGIAIDSHDNLYINDVGNVRVRKVDTAGIISTIAGNGVPGYSGDGGPATTAQIKQGYNLAVDHKDNLYIADSTRIRKIDTMGIISTIAGTGILGYTGDNDLATSANIGVPYGIAIDKDGVIYFADRVFNCVRRVDTSGIITTVAGNGIAGFSGDGGPASMAELNTPLGVAMDRIGNLYISDEGNYRLRKIINPGNTFDTTICVTAFPQVIQGRGIQGTYLWSTGEQTAAITVSVPGLYWRTTTGSNYVYSDTIRIGLIPEVALGNDTVVCSATPIRIGTLQDGVRYAWNTGDSLCCILPKESGTYKVIASNICGTVSDSISINFLPDCNDCIWTPTAFTPNGDSKNDLFRVTARCPIRNYRIRIFDRYGREVFTASDIGQGWDGRFNGVVQDANSFYYLIEYITDLPGSRKQTLKGDVMLVR